MTIRLRSACSTNWAKEALIHTKNLQCICTCRKHLPVALQKCQSKKISVLHKNHLNHVQKRWRAINVQKHILEKCCSPATSFQTWWHYAVFQKIPKKRFVLRPLARLGENKSQHISQLFGYKFQSNKQHLFQSKHSHSTPGISINFHTITSHGSPMLVST